MKVLKYLFFLILIVVIGASIYIATRPDEFNVSRDLVVNAPKSVVLPYIEDYKKWPEWSPWLEKEPSAKITYGDTTAGINASYSWKGEILGEGNIKTLYHSKDSLSQKITFLVPHQSTADVYWTLTEDTNSGTKIEWGMKGEMSFMEKAFILYKGGMDKVLGPDLKRGLSKLDSLITTDMAKYTINPKGVSDHGGGYYLYITIACKQKDLPEKMAELYTKINSFTQENNIVISGPAFALYHEWDELNKTTIFSACVPIKEKIVTSSESGVLCGLTSPGKYYKTVLTGDYKNLPEAWSIAKKTIKSEKLIPDDSRDPMEVYLNTPAKTQNPAKLITEIYIPIKEKITFHTTL